MMHVAPCSCELHVRIRELEAEVKIQTVTAENLERDNQYLRDRFQQENARAEKAEAELADIHSGNAFRNLRMRAQMAEARVAEREHEHGPECEALYANEPEHFGHAPVASPMKPGTTNVYCEEHRRYEAREREAD